MVRNLRKGESIILVFGLLVGKLFFERSSSSTSKKDGIDLLLYSLDGHGHGLGIIVITGGDVVILVNFKHILPYISLITLVLWSQFSSLEMDA